MRFSQLLHVAYRKTDTGFTIQKQWPVTHFLAHTSARPNYITRYIFTKTRLKSNFSL